MVSNQILQSTLSGITSITDCSAAIYDINGKMIASEGSFNGIEESLIFSFFKSGQKEMHAAGCILIMIYDETEPVYVAVVPEETKMSQMTVQLIDLQVESLVQAYKEKLDKDNFVKNILLDNLLQIDIFNRARKLHIEFRQARCVFMIETVGQEAAAHDILKQFVAGKGNDYLTVIDEDNQVIVHESRTKNAPYEELCEYAGQMYEALLAGGISAKVSYGTIVAELKDISRSYKEAKLARDVSRIFYENNDIISYNNLGIGRIIYQLPLNLCRMFINEIFSGKTIDEFDEETLVTINKFFENNLNVSETSRQLFIHRNTLVYRLDKLQKTTGLDLRVFDDAITFKIALMVVKYMDYMEKIDY